MAHMSKTLTDCTCYINGVYKSLADVQPLGQPVLVETKACWLAALIGFLCSSFTVKPLVVR